MPFFIKKPIPIEAHPYKGDDWPEHERRIRARGWDGDVRIIDGRVHVSPNENSPEGQHEQTFEAGNYIVQAAAGEVYPMTQDVMEETYEEVVEEGMAEDFSEAEEVDL